MAWALPLEAFAVSYTQFIALLFDSLMIDSLVVLANYYRYGRWELRYWYVPPVTLLGWFVAFSIVYMIPTEIAATRYERCLVATPDSCNKPLTYVPFETRVILWRVIYWVLAAGTWLIFPILQGYSMSGGFRPLEKLWMVLRFNLIYYAITIVVGIILLTVMFVQYDISSGDALMGVCIALGNAWGLFLLVCFMGYGLVEIPRSFWWRANRDIVGNYYRFRVAALHNKVREAREHLARLLSQIKRQDLDALPADPLRPYVVRLFVVANFDILVNKCHTYGLDYAAANPASKSLQLYSELVDLHRELILTEHNWTITHSLYETIVEEAIAFDDVQNARAAHSGVIYWSVRPRRTWPGHILLDRLEYVWHVLCREPLYRGVAVALAIASVITVWSEITFFSDNPVLSVWARLINIKSLTEAGLQFLVFFVVVFMTYCSYSSLFRLEVMTFFRLVPRGLSDPYSLLFSAAYLARLFYPLCYNVLFVVRYATEGTSDVPQTAFVKFMGVVNQVPVFGHWYFQLVFPITVLLVVFLVAADFHKRIIACFTDVFEQEEDFEHASLKEGKELIQRERTARLAGSGALPDDNRRIVPLGTTRLRAGPAKSVVDDDERSDVELFRTRTGKPPASPAVRSAKQEEGLWSSVLKRFGRGGNSDASREESL